jgi:hypothetical protein
MQGRKSDTFKKEKNPTFSNYWAYYYNFNEIIINVWSVFNYDKTDEEISAFYDKYWKI